MCTSAQSCGATPDGRQAGVPLVRGHLPGPGRGSPRPDRRPQIRRQDGPRPHRRHAAQQKFNPQVLEGDDGLDHLKDLIRAYFRLDGHHIQFNVVDAETLREAQAKPEEYRNLIVRVAGYSDYFVDLGQDLQNEIIARTEQKAF